MWPFFLNYMKKVLFLLFITFQLSLFSQVEMRYNSSIEDLPNWVQLMYTENPDAGEVIETYTNYYKKNKLVKNKHNQYYKRWLRSISRFSDAKPNTTSSKSSNQWECIGPWDFDKDAASRSYAPGAAHVYTVEQAVSNPNILYAGSATAGAWKTIDKGANWNLITADLALNGVYAIEIDFTNPEIIYISGNGGIYKSNDGGGNWTIIGDATFTNLSHSTKDIKLKPTNNMELFVASDEGLYNSLDGGLNFTQVLSGEFLEIEFHPNSADTMYFVRKNGDKTEFYRSDDGGITLINFTNGWPNPGAGDDQKRTEIAVSPAAPNKIVALATGEANGGSGLYGIYISDDKGENWTFQCCGPQPAGAPDTNNINMMGWQPTGLDDGGQYYYDLALAVNPTNADIIHVGGVNHWISFDNGVSFSCPSKWSTPHKKGYVHADIHDINYFGNDLWFACDGGIFYSDNAGDSIYKKQYGIAGTDFWGFGVGFKDGEVMLGGTYHNGTLLKDGNTYTNDWLCTDGGDGIRGFVNFGSPRVSYSDYGGKTLSGDRTIDISTFSLDKKPNASYIIGESSQMEFDPRCYNWNYIGNDTSLWLSKNNGASYSAVHHFNEKVTSVEVAWSNPDVIYVATWESWWGDKKIYRTNDAGQTWTDITPTNINGQAWIPYDISISSNDANTLWIARCSMYGAVQDAQGYEVFKSSNGGTTWDNWSTPTLDNINASNIEHQRGSNGGVYIGTRDAVYYRNNSMTDWDIYDVNLPKSTFSTQLVPYYREGLLRNGTNRSAYEIDLYENTPPSAQIAADRLSVNCMNDTVQFVDHSAVRLSSATWQWTFPGGTPSTSTLEDPIVVYGNPGTYGVTLTVTDAFGTSTQTYTDFITYTDSVFPISNTTALYEGFDTGNFPPISWETPPATFSWQSIVVDTGINCQPNTVAYVNHYYIQQNGQEAYLISNKVKLGAGTGAQNWLTYDYAYSGYAAGYDDGLRIDISTDCGSTWDSIYGAIGADLQTTAYVGSPWYPTCGSWATDSINLSNWGLNGDTIMVRFVAINDYGNRFFMDNVNINGQNIIIGLEDEVTNFHTSIYPNPTKGMFSIRTDVADLKLEIYTALGRLVIKESVTGGLQQIDLSQQPKGIYFVKLMHDGKTEQRKLILQ
jgi:photosystem II stability/assembly factor-like uncharacterized protein